MNQLGSLLLEVVDDTGSIWWGGLSWNIFGCSWMGTCLHVPIFKMLVLWNDSQEPSSPLFSQCRMIINLDMLPESIWRDQEPLHVCSNFSLLEWIKGCQEPYCPICHEFRGCQWHQKFLNSRRERRTNRPSFRGDPLLCKGVT